MVLESATGMTSSEVILSLAAWERFMLYTSRGSLQKGCGIQRIKNLWLAYNLRTQ
jgi:hypothetical protein